MLESTRRARKHASKYKPSQARLFARYRKSAPPKDGWSHETFTGVDASNLTRDTVDIRNFAMVKGVKRLVPRLNTILRAQAERVVTRVDATIRSIYGPGKSAKALTEITIDIPEHENIWAEVIEQELRLAGAEVSTEMQPIVQSVADDVFGKVGIVFGSQVTHQNIATHQNRTRQLAQRVTGINQTTKLMLGRLVKRSLIEGATVSEVQEAIRKGFPMIAENRTNTIARTELGNAADRATLWAMRSTGVVAYVSVIGCEHVEQSAPHFRGIPSCNISNVPIEFEDQLRFHINHTGAIVASGFRKKDGTIPYLPLRGAPYDR